MIETRLLQYFLAVAEEQSITRAAEFLHISQPTLSKQMMDLEATLNKQLLIRGKKQITLTEEGEYLRGKAREIIDLVSQTESAFHESDTGIGGEIYIGCGEFRSIYPLMRDIQDVQSQYPDIHVHFFSGNADHIIERLDKGLVDFGILLEADFNDKYEYYKLPFYESWGILMPKACPLAEKKSIIRDELSSVPLIMPSQSSNSGKLAAWLNQAAESTSPVATYNLIYNASLMVAAGIGYALCIDGIANTSHESPLTFRPLEPALHSDIYLVCKKYQTFSKPAKLLMERLKSL